MKKFSVISSFLLLSAVVTFLFIGCQKESAAVDEQTTATDGESSAIKGVSGGSASAIHGLISESDAVMMAAEYAKSNPKGRTTHVSYATKDLIAFLKTLNSKYKSDSVYVTFGIYNKKTAHTPGQVGRTTVFFMGNNGGGIGSKSVKTNGISISDEVSSNYMNQGGMAPPATEQ
jgi:hypothetical protein